MFKMYSGYHRFSGIQSDTEKVEVRSVELTGFKMKDREKIFHAFISSHLDYCAFLDL